MKFKLSLLKIIGFVLIVLIVYIWSYIKVFKDLDKKYSSFNSLPIIELGKINSGYTLIAPYNRILSDKDIVGKIYLLDLLGNKVHEWKTNNQALYSILKKDGNLVVTSEIPKYSQMYPPGGNTGTVQELDWDSNVIWEYKNDAMHHDIITMPNGNLTVAIWEKIPAEIASQIQGGVENTEIQGTIWSDEIAEIDKNGKKIWSWHAYEQMDPSVDILSSLITRSAWSFINGMSYTDKNPIDGTPAYALSMRAIDTVMVVRKNDGEIIWRSPKGMLSKQHDPTFLSNGNILVFDNGLERVPNPFPIYGSRVVEIDPKTNKIVWQFEGGKNAIDRVRFFAPLVSGAQRLSNGNTLITEGTRGHIFEVDPEGNIVWDLISPYTTTQTGAFPNNFLFKSRRYSEKDVKFPQNIKPAFPHFQYNLYNFLKKLYFEV